MKIEILTRQMEKKAELLTLVSKEKDFYARGDIVSADGLEMETGPDYILIDTRRPAFAEALVKALFTIRPVPFAPAFYEIITDQKVLITASAHTPLRIMPNLDKLAHLDLDRQELAGYFEKTWQSRDVAVLADAEVMVQGGLAVCKVKFKGHFRESEHHCRACLEKVSIAQLLGLFTDEEVGAHPIPVKSNLFAEARAFVQDKVFSDFLNRYPGKMLYGNDVEEFSIILGGERDWLKFKAGQNTRGVEVALHIETPSSTCKECMKLSMEMLDFGNIRVSQKISALLLKPEDLIKQIGFEKDAEFFQFTYFNGNMQARYNIKDSELTVWIDMPWNVAEVERLPDLFGQVGNFVSRVTEYAV